MGRLGERDPEAVVELARALRRGRPARAGRRLDPLRDRRRAATTPSSREQLARLRRRSPSACASWRPACVVHAANSAATLREPGSHFDMVRCGVAIYGLDPFGADPAEQRPRAGAGAALLRRRREALRGRRRAPATGAPGGRRPTPGSGCCRSATATGSGAALSNNAEVLVGGRRHPLVGTVSMDNVTIDLGPETEVEPGDEAVLIGAQGAERDPRRGAGARGWRRSTTRSPADLAPGAAGRTRRERRRSLEPRLAAARVRRRGARGARRRGRSLDRRRRGPRRRCSARRSATLDLAVAPGTRAGRRAGDRAGGRRLRLPALRASTRPGASVGRRTTAAGTST